MVLAASILKSTSEQPLLHKQHSKSHEHMNNHIFKTHLSCSLLRSYQGDILKIRTNKLWNNISYANFQWFLLKLYILIILDIMTNQLNHKKKPVNIGYCMYAHSRLNNFFLIFFLGNNCQNSDEYIFVLDAFLFLFFIIYFYGPKGYF